jgi:hypothetical protein
LYQKAALGGSIITEISGMNTQRIVLTTRYHREQSGDNLKLWQFVCFSEIETVVFKQGYSTEQVGSAKARYRRDPVFTDSVTTVHRGPKKNWKIKKLNGS